MADPLCARLRDAATALVLVSLGGLAACSTQDERPNVPEWKRVTHDLCMQRELFAECLSLVPTGPNRTKYSDWDEVVEQCRTASSLLSRRMAKFVKDECKEGEFAWTR